jgi:hypothetical protein
MRTRVVSRWLCVVAACLFAVMIVVRPVRADVGQACEAWQPVVPLSGADRPVYDSVRFDSDGSGPQPERLLVCGEFTTIGDIQSSYLAYWNGTRFEAWDGPSVARFGRIMALAVREDELYILTWSGLMRVRQGAWENVIASPVFSSHADSITLRWFKGELYAIVRSLAVVYRLGNGTWQQVGMTNSSGQVRVVQIVGEDLYLAGQFSSFNGMQTDGLVRFDGRDWSVAGDSRFVSTSSTKIEALVSLRGNLYAIGSISWRVLGGTRPIGVARWDGQSWRTAGGTSEDGRAIVAGVAGNQLLAIGYVPTGFSVGQSPAVLRFSGDQWQSVGEWPLNFSSVPNVSLTSIRHVTEFGDRLLVFRSGSYTGMSVINAQGVDERVGLDAGARRVVGWREQVAVLSRDSRVFLGQNRGRGPWREIPVRLPNRWFYSRAADMCVWNDMLVLVNDVTSSEIAPTVTPIQFDGTTWREIGTTGQLRGGATQVFVHQGRLHVAGGLSVGTTGLSIPLAEFDGSVWLPAGGASVQPGAVPLFSVRPAYSGSVAQPSDFKWFSDGTRILVGGPFVSVGGVAARGCAAFDGQRWEALDEGFEPGTYPVSFRVISGSLHAGAQFRVHSLAGRTWQSVMVPMNWPFAYFYQGGLLVGEHNGRPLVGAYTGTSLGPPNSGLLASFDTVFGETYAAGAGPRGGLGVHVARLGAGTASLGFVQGTRSVRVTEGQSTYFSGWIQTAAELSDITVEKDGVRLSLGRQPSGAVLNTRLDGSLELSNTRIADRGTYRIVATPTCGGAVRSDQISLAVYCLADYDKNDRVDGADVFKYLDDWFAGVPISNGSVARVSSVNGLMEFLAAWFAGC